MSEDSNSKICYWNILRQKEYETEICTDKENVINGINESKKNPVSHFLNCFKI